MLNTKINSLLLPFLIAILLATSSKLRVGNKIDNVIYSLLTPVSLPVIKSRLYLQERYSFLKNISQLQKQNHDQKNQIASLLTENEYLKQKLADNKVLADLKISYRGIIPVRLTGSTGNFIVTSSQPLDDVRPGMPIISGTVLLGTVKEVRGNVATIIPLDSEKSPSFPIHTTSGQKGLYKFEDNSSQITDVPSQSPIVLGDIVLTEPGEIFPPNLIVGKTSHLLTVSQEPLQKAEIILYDTLDKNPDNLAIITKP